ncbi:MAG: SPFH domain-containing protein, partial [Chloroflexales bacterium]
MKELLAFIASTGITFVLAFFLVPLLIGLGRLFGIFTIVREGNCHVYTLFGNVVGVLREPGLYILPTKLGLSALIINFFGKCYVLDMRLDQSYLRSQPVNSEEGAPMGIGAWFEMKISDPVAYLFKNADPQGSLAANVSNAVVRTLSNLPLGEMLENRHAMSSSVRAEVSPKSVEWGYQLG